MESANIKGSARSTHKEHRPSLESSTDRPPTNQDNTDHQGKRNQSPQRGPDDDEDDDQNNQQKPRHEPKKSKHKAKNNKKHKGQSGSKGDGKTSKKGSAHDQLRLAEAEAGLDARDIRRDNSGSDSEGPGDVRVGTSPSSKKNKKTKTNKNNKHKQEFGAKGDAKTNKKGHPNDQLRLAAAGAGPDVADDDSGSDSDKPGVVHFGRRLSNEDDDEHVFDLEEQQQQGTEEQYIEEHGLSTAQPIVAELATDTANQALQEEVERLGRLTQELQQRDAAIVTAEVVKDEAENNHHERQLQRKRRLYIWVACGLLVVLTLGIGLGVGLSSQKQEEPPERTQSPTPLPVIDVTFSQMGSAIVGESDLDNFGESVAMSEDGNRIVVSSMWNDGNGPETGHVRVFEWTEDAGDWKQVGSDIDGEGENAYIGQSVDISADGNSIIVGSPWPDANETVITGSARVYDWKGETIGWQQRGLTLLGEDVGELFGYTVAMSSKGTRVAIGGYYNEFLGPYTGHVRVYDWIDTGSMRWEQVGDDIYGDAPYDNFGFAVTMNSHGSRIVATYGDGDRDPGHVRVLDWTGDEWVRVGSDLHGEGAGDDFGRSVAMSADGNRIVVGTNNNDNNGINSGYAQVFEWTGIEWEQVGTDISGKNANDEFGWRVAMSADGNRIVVSSRLSSANGVLSGQVRVFDWTGRRWLQAGADIDGEAPEDEFGYSVAISSDGSRVAASALYNDDSGTDAGNVRVFEIEPVSLK